jgi:transcriptional repressor NrdR
MRKRPVEPERLERMVSGIVRQLENAGESEVSASTIGNMVMDGLKALDDVAYVRFASVYKDFREARDFEELLGELSNSEEINPEDAIQSARSRNTSETS